jgi:large subunit ribosomal protein L33
MFSLLKMRSAAIYMDPKERSRGAPCHADEAPALNRAETFCYNKRPHFIKRTNTTMAKKGEKREIIRLVCTEDGKNYYTTTKNKVNTQAKLELMKFNPKLRKVTLHREKK